MDNKNFIDSLISIIVPVYKTKKYISRCIESIIRQTYMNWELILIDDGSPDGTGNICDKYALENSKITVIHKKNEGVSKARNEGIKNAQGEFIVFVDSDDWLPCDSLEVLINKYKNEMLDLVVGNYDYRELKVSCDLLNECVINLTNPQDENIAYFLLSHVLNAPWCKMFKSNIIFKNKVFFDEDIKYGEDALFIREYLLFCEKISLSNKIVYHYNLLNNGAASLKHYDKKNEWLSKTIQQLDVLLKKIKFDANKRKELLSIKSFSLFLNSITYPIKKFNKKSAKKYIKDTIVFFKNWIILDTNWLTEKNSKKEIFDALVNENIEGIYRSYKKVLNKHRMRRRIRFFLTSLLRPIIEKNRDKLKRMRR